MKLLDNIAIKGLIIAQKNGLVNLPEKKEIPFCEEIIEDFLNRLIEDLFDFATITQYINNETLFSRAAVYSYGKGAEFALSHLYNSPLERIGYKFDNCMESKISDNFPPNILLEINKHIPVIKEMFQEMFQETKGSQEKYILAGITFGNCVFKMLSGVFFIGKKVGLSCEIENNGSMDFNYNDVNVNWDYDTYDNKYKEDDINDFYK